MGDSAKGRCRAQIRGRLELVSVVCLCCRYRGSSYVLHTDASLRAGRGTAGGSWQRAEAAQPQAASEDPALSPQTARGGEEGRAKLGRRETCGTGLEVKAPLHSVVGHVMEGLLLHSDSFPVTCEGGG